MQERQLGFPLGGARVCLHDGVSEALEGRGPVGPPTLCHTRCTSCCHSIP